MKDNGHFITSLIKSAIRIGSCIYAIRKKSLVVFATGFLVAEGLGVAEELLDKRE